MSDVASHILSRFSKARAPAPKMTKFSFMPVISVKIPPHLLDEVSSTARLNSGASIRDHQDLRLKASWQS